MPYISFHCSFYSWHVANLNLIFVTVATIFMPARMIINFIWKINILYCPHENGKWVQLDMCNWWHQRRKAVFALSHLYLNFIFKKIMMLWEIKQLVSMLSSKYIHTFKDFLYVAVAALKNLLHNCISSILDGDLYFSSKYVRFPFLATSIKSIWSVHESGSPLKDYLSWAVEHQAEDLLYEIPISK